LKKVTGLIFLLVFYGSLFAQQNFLKDLQEHKNEFNFIVIGDRTGAGADSWKVLQKSISEINSINPDFVVFIGDLIDGYDLKNTPVKVQWETFLSRTSSLKAPYCYVPGNHDIYNMQSYNFWKNKFGRTYYSFTYKNNGFIILNTEETLNRAGGGFGKKQIEFAKQAISSFKGMDRIFIFMHRPAWITRSVLKNDWLKIKTALANIPFTVIAGHLHVLAQTYDLDNNKYIVVGPTGGKMRMSRNPALGLVNHYTLVNVKHGKINISFIEPGKIYSQKIAESAYKRMSIFMNR